MLFAQVSRTVNVLSAGTLSSLLPANEREAITKLKLTGTVDARDFMTMRDSLKALTELDFSGAGITEYIGTNGTYPNLNFAYSANTIPPYAFYGSMNLTSILMPETITGIANSAFVYCAHITSIHIPSSVTDIGDWAFYGCYELTSVTIPPGVVSIGFSAFSDCYKLSSVDIPSSVTFFGQKAFDWCFGILSITMTSATPVEMNTYIYFNETNKTTCTLYVPIGSGSAYRSSNQWNGFTHVVEGKGLWLSDSILCISDTLNSNGFTQVHSNTTWTASCDQSWITLNPDTTTNGNAILRFTASENTASTRKAKITVTAQGIEPQTIIITQALLAVYPKTIFLSADANSHSSIDINTDTIWTAKSRRDWLTISPDPLNKSTLILTATDNSLPWSRTSLITIYAHDLIDTVTVIQAPWPLAIKPISDNNPSIYPNPATTSFTVKTEGNATVLVYTTNGEVILCRKISGEEIIQTKNMPSGLYLVKIITDHLITTQKLILDNH
jgi:hypothetical protein